MTSLKEALIQDTLQFLRQSFASNHQFFVPSTYPQKTLLKPIAPSNPKSVEEPLPIQNPTPIKLSPRKHTPPSKKLPPPPIEVVEPVHKECLPLPVESYKKVLGRLFPQILLVESIPSDAVAKIGNTPLFQQALEAPTLLLTTQEDPFIRNIELAIRQYLVPCHVFLVDPKTSAEEISFLCKNMQAKVVIATADILQDKKILPLLRSFPASTEIFLASSSLVVLEPLTEYYTYVDKKKILWQTLCKKLSPLRT